MSNSQRRKLKVIFFTIIFFGFLERNWNFAFFSFSEEQKMKENEETKPVEEEKESKEEQKTEEGSFPHKPKNFLFIKS